MKTTGKNKYSTDEITLLIKKLHSKSNELDEINELLGITPKSKDITGETVIDAIRDMQKLLVKYADKSINLSLLRALKVLEENFSDLLESERIKTNNDARHYWGIIDEARTAIKQAEGVQ